MSSERQSIGGDLLGIRPAQHYYLDNEKLHHLIPLISGLAAQGNHASFGVGS
jgi:hypothetical protein